MSLKRKMFGMLTALAITISAVPAVNMTNEYVSAAEDISSTMEWGAVKIGGGGFVSGIVTGKEAMYARTDVGGAYRYDYKQNKWIQLMDFINEEDRGFLSIDAMCIDPADDNTIYLLAGCAYFSAERTAIFKSTDGGETFTEHDVTDLIKVHGNGYGRQFGEAIAVDPNNSDIIYCGGDTDGLIMSTDAGETWSYVESFNDLGLFQYEVNWPSWTDTIEKTTVGEDYTKVNGIGTIAISNGKVYVGVSDNTLKDSSGKTIANIYVADVGKDNWEPLSDDLPKDLFPSRINKDADGNLLISYVKGIAFDGSDGAAYRYDIKTKTVTNISPKPQNKNVGIGAVVSDKDNPDSLIATSCGLWWSQLYYDVGEDWSNVPNGDLIFRSEDGGKTWYTMQHGCSGDGAWGTKSADYISTNGYSWIENKAIHWSGAIVIDPKNSSKVLVTSGNGIFACDDIWAELPQFYFDPNGIEEVVAQDMISIPGGNEYSVIGDYDGFEHTSVYESGKQHQPNMGSTYAIAYCPQNPDVMVRFAEHDSKGYYTTDGGENWIGMSNSGGSGGRAAIAQLENGNYRIFHTSQYGNIQYSDDFGDSWSTCSGIKGSKTPGITVDAENPQYVYAYAAQYNAYWASDTSKTEPSFDDACYILMVSNDYGATFTQNAFCKYDQCDVANRIGYLGEGKIFLGAGWYGAYISTDYGKTVKKLDSVFYCKTVGYGAPEKEGDANTLYMYGKPNETDPEGIYRSQDSGETWVLINKDKLYGGTGNGNFLIGDMNEFGTVYMSTVGCGIVYGKLSDTNPNPPVTTAITTSGSPTTSTTVTTTIIVTPTDETGSDLTVPSGIEPTRYGDVNVDGDVNVADVVKLNMYLLNNKENMLEPEGMANADCVYDQLIDTSDSAIIMNYVAMMITEDKLGPQE